MASSFSRNPSESLELARMRTLLALERNYMAEERTCLAEFRTGLALSLIGPPGIAVFSAVLPLETTLWMFVVIYGFLAIATAWGLFMVVQSQRKLFRIKKDKALVLAKEQVILDQSPEIRDLLMDCISSERKCDVDENA